MWRSANGKRAKKFANMRAAKERKRLERIASEDVVPDMLHGSASEGTWWCNSHCREATHTDENGGRCCDPDLAGILLQCSVVFAPMVVKYRRPNH